MVPSFSSPAASSAGRSTNTPTGTTAGSSRSRRVRTWSGVRFRRLRCLAELPGATAELALDEGVFTGGGRETPFWELEAELKGGSEDALAQWCRSLADAWGLLEEPRSKFLRAMALTEK